jgi:hypothetical protein
VPQEVVGGAFDDRARVVGSHAHEKKCVIGDLKFVNLKIRSRPKRKYRTGLVSNYQLQITNYKLFLAFARG